MVRHSVLADRQRPLPFPNSRSTAMCLLQAQALHLRRCRRPLQRLTHLTFNPFNPCNRFNPCNSFTTPGTTHLTHLTLVITSGQGTNSPFGSIIGIFELVPLSGRITILSSPSCPGTITMHE